MSEENAPQPEPAAEASAPETSSGSTHQKRILLVAYPKIVYLYPTLVMAIICGLSMWISDHVDTTEPRIAQALAAENGAVADGEEAGTLVEENTGHVLARVFMLVMAINLVVITFDFPRTTSLTLFFAGVAVCVVIWSLFRLNPTFIPWVNQYIIHAFRPFANATFYFLVAIVLILMYIGVAISVRFDYWEVRPNELLHHHGLLSDLKRYSAPNLRIDKEINDVFEYLLLRSGRLILHPSNERRAIVLENVFFINRKEAEITRMLGAVQVQVRDQ